jgi:hypothetical protein
MRARVAVSLSVLLAAGTLSPVFGADTCNNRTSCEGKLQTQILAAWPKWTAKLDATCTTLLYAGYPHCAQLVWNGNGIPWITYGETDITTGGSWLNHAKAPKHRATVTPDAVLGVDQLDVTPHGCVLVHEYGDVRGGGEMPGYWVELLVCMRTSPGVGEVARVYTRGHPWGGDGWADGDLSKCAATGNESLGAGAGKEPK